MRIRGPVLIAPSARHGAITRNLPIPTERAWPRRSRMSACGLASPEGLQRGEVRRRLLPENAARRMVPQSFGAAIESSQKCRPGNSLVNRTAQRASRQSSRPVWRYGSLRAQAATAPSIADGEVRASNLSRTAGIICVVRSGVPRERRDAPLG